MIRQGDKTITVDMDWEVGSHLIPVEINDKPLTLQYFEHTPMGFKLVHYGTVVCGVAAGLGYTPGWRAPHAVCRPVAIVWAARVPQFEVSVFTPRQFELIKHIKERPKLDASKVVLSPMPGSVVSLAVKPGDKASDRLRGKAWVQAPSLTGCAGAAAWAGGVPAAAPRSCVAGVQVVEGQEVAIVEAMKMQNVLRAPRFGTVKTVNVQVGSSVVADEILLEFVDETKKA